MCHLWLKLDMQQYPQLLIYILCSNINAMNATNFLLIKSKAHLDAKSILVVQEEAKRKQYEKAHHN